MKNQKQPLKSADMKPVLPALLSSKQVAGLLEIPPTNMTAQKKVKGFPTPVYVFDKFSVWLESDIVAWKEARVK